MCAPRTSRTCPPDQARAIASHRALAVSGAAAASARRRGQNHSLRALRAAAHRTGKQVLVLAPTGKAVDEAMREDAGDRGFTVAKALQLLRRRPADPGPAHPGGRRRGRHGRHPRPAPAAGGHNRRARQAGSGRRRLPAGPGQSPRRHVRPPLRRPALDAAPLRGVADARPRRTRRLAGAALGARQPAAQSHRLVPHP